MKKNTVCVVLLTLLILEFEINAQESPQTFVNPMTGKDVDVSKQPNQQPKLKKSCSDKLNPCKTITFALKQTKNGGTITLLYADAFDDETKNTCKSPYDNRIEITKSVTIQADKALKGKPCIIVRTREEGIKINKENSIVKLKGIRFYGEDGDASNGVSFFSGSKLVVERCYFYHIVHNISFDEGELIVKDSTFNEYNKAIFLRNSSKKKVAKVSNSKFIGIGEAALLVENNGYVLLKNNNTFSPQ